VLPGVSIPAVLAFAWWGSGRSGNPGRGWTLTVLSPFLRKTMRTGDRPPLNRAINLLRQARDAAPAQRSRPRCVALGRRVMRRAASATCKEECSN
jgi:hypothetical protein